MGKVFDFNEAKKKRRDDRCAYLNELLEEVERWDPEAALRYQLGLGSSRETAVHQRVINILRTEKEIFLKR